jgi:hypothetical protein
MGKWRSLGVDVAIVLAWGAVIYLLRDMSSQLELLLFIGATLLAGLLSGRLRIAVAPLMPAVAVAFAVLLSGGCDSSTPCDDSGPLWLGLVALGVIAVVAGSLLALGAFLRQRWDALPAGEPVK